MPLFRPREINVDKELGKLRRRIGKRLDRKLTAIGVPSKTLHAAMRHAALPLGKCLRGGLVYASGRALGIEDKRLDGAAAAVELAHAYSLTHDDLPCMDDDDERRGRPACHRVYGEATAMLAGNGLLLRAMEELLDGAWPAERTCEAMLELVQSCGARGLLAGQQRDLDGMDNVDTLAVTAISKTGSLIGAAVRLPALLGGEDSDLDLDPPGLDKVLAGFSWQVGIGFQIRDDLEDLEQDGGGTRPTYATLYGEERCLTLLGEMQEGALQALNALDERADLLRELGRIMTAAPDRYLA